MGMDLDDIETREDYLQLIKTINKLEQENEALRGLLGARIRVEEGFKETLPEQLFTPEVRNNDGTV